MNQTLPSRRPGNSSRALRWRTPLAVMLALNLLFVVRIPAHALWNLADYTVRQIDFSFGATNDEAQTPDSPPVLAEPVTEAAAGVGNAICEYSSQSSRRLEDASETMGHWIAEFTRAGAPEPKQPEPTGVQPTSTTAPLVLTNLYNGKATIHFALDGKVVTLQPGQSTELRDGRQHVVLFHRGGNFGNVQQVLTQGRFGFHVGNSGWELKKAP